MFKKRKPRKGTETFRRFVAPVWENVKFKKRKPRKGTETQRLPSKIERIVIV